MRTFHVQGWLELIGKEAALGRNCLKHIKSFISGVFNLAKQQGYFQGEDPVRDTAVSPEAAEPQETYAYTSDEIQAMLGYYRRPRGQHWQWLRSPGCVEANCKSYSGKIAEMALFA